MIGAMPACVDCKNLISMRDNPRCNAFPRGIPEDILMGGNNHINPFKGDHGIQFEKA